MGHLMILDNDNMAAEFYQPDDADVIQRRLECLELTLKKFHLTPREVKIIKNVQLQWQWHLKHAQQVNAEES